MNSPGDETQAFSFGRGYMFKELYNKLEELYYTSEFTPDGEIVADVAMAWYKLYGALDGYDGIRKKDRKSLDRWYKSVIIGLDDEDFGWDKLGSGTGFYGCSGVILPNSLYIRGPGISG